VLLDALAAPEAQLDAIVLVGAQAIYLDAASPGSLMAARATELLEDPATIAASCAALASDVLDALRQS
jgi:hypothetical protein